MKLLVDIASQHLQLLDDAGKVQNQWLVSTAVNGPGEQGGSMKTPRGLHVLRAKAGVGLASHSVLRGRRPTGEVHSAALTAAQPERDFVLTRVLWLSGVMPGFNRIGPVDSMRRYIYIHGTPDSEPMGVPASHGCIRMRNADLLELDALVDVGVAVLIREDAGKPAPIHVVPWPVNADLDRYALRQIGPTLPDSPVPGSVPKRWAAWREDGVLLAALTWKPTSGACLVTREGVQVADVLPLLWRHAAEAASQLGHKELRGVLKPEWLKELDEREPLPVEPVRELGVDDGAALLVRGWL